MSSALLEQLLTPLYGPKTNNMTYSRLGNSGLVVSRIVLGCMGFGNPNKQMFEWTIPGDQAEPIIKRAIELGVNFFDTADMYSFGESEVVLGNILRKLKVPRENIVIATKVWMPLAREPNRGGLSRKHINDAINASLKHLGMDYVDLYQIHRADPEVPPEETMKALHDLVVAGKVRYIGASSMYAHEFAEYQRIAEINGWTKFVSMQNHYNLIYREEEREMIPYCKKSGVGIIPWSPLARGFLTGGDRKIGQAPATLRAKFDFFTQTLYTDPADNAIIDAVKKVAEGKKLTSTVVALAWLLHKGVTGPIIGPTKLHQLEEAVQAVTVQLTPEEIKTLEEAYKPHAVSGH